MQDTVQVVIDSLTIINDSINIQLSDNTSLPIIVEFADKGRLEKWIEIVFPIAVIVVSIVTLLLSSNHNRKTMKEMSRQHKANFDKEIDQSKRSVRPILGFGLDIEQDDDGLYYICRLTNNGLGPGIIDKVVITFNDKDYNSLFDVFNEYKILPPQILIEKLSKFSTLERHALGAKESYPLFRIAISKQKIHNLVEVRNILHNFFKEVDISFNYQSIYEEVFHEKGPVVNPDHYDTILT